MRLNIMGNFNLERNYGILIRTKHIITVNCQFSFPSVVLALKYVVWLKKKSKTSKTVLIVLINFFRIVLHVCSRKFYKSKYKLIFSWEE